MSDEQTLDRRTVLKTTAAATGAIAGLGATAGTAAATHDYCDCNGFSHGCHDLVEVNPDVPYYSGCDGNFLGLTNDTHNANVLDCCSTDSSTYYYLNHEGVGKVWFEGPDVQDP